MFKNKLYRLFIIGLSMLCFTGLIAESPRATVSLIDNIAVMAPDITLGEIAQIESEDELFKEELSELVIDQVPSIGLARSITSHKVKKVFEKHHIKNVKVMGIQASVLTLNRKMEHEEMKQWIKEWVDENIESHVTAEVNFSKLPREWRIPLGPNVKLVVEARTQNLGGKMRLRLKSIVGDKVLSRSSAKVMIAKNASTYVVTRPLARGDEIRPSDVEKRTVDVTHFNGLEIRNLEDIEGMLTARTIGVGEVIKVQDLEQPILVKSGSLNQIVVENGPIKMRISGAKALQNGKKGDHILFSNPLNKNEKLQAEVIKEGLAVMKIR